MVDRVMVALALLFALVASSVAQGTHPAGRIAATLYPAPGAARGSKAAAALPDNMQGPFKADPEAPIHIEADRLVEGFDGAKQAVFSGNVKLLQGGVGLLLKPRSFGGLRGCDRTAALRPTRSSVGAQGKDLGELFSPK